MVVESVGTAGFFFFLAEGGFGSVEGAFLAEPMSSSLRARRFLAGLLALALVLGEPAAAAAVGGVRAGCWAAGAAEGGFWFRLPREPWGLGVPWPLPRLLLALGACCCVLFELRACCRGWLLVAGPMRKVVEATLRSRSLWEGSMVGNHSSSSSSSSSSVDVSLELDVSGGSSLGETIWGKLLLFLAGVVGFAGSENL